jgi:FkbM family methyltransferase
MHIDLNEPADRLLDLLRTPHLRVHFSQLGEDALLWHYFHDKSDGFYVDVGCHDPLRYSNTHLLSHFRNWRGINIDADERAILAFQTTRPRDINLCVGVGMSEGSKPFTIFNDGAVNTFDPAMAAQQSPRFGEGATRPIQIKKLATILSEHVPEAAQIDYMNVDCEGLDHEVIESNDWTRFRPAILSVEIHGLNLEAPLSNPLVAFLKQQSYRMRSHYFATTFFERMN